MRHGKKFNHLGRKAPHRKAMLMNMANSLILHKRIRTTVAKAKALRVFVEPIITKSKNDTTHSRRVVFSYLRDKEAVKELFGPVAEKVAARPGGYTRILKIGNRLGDNAEMAIIELVDFNELAPGKLPGDKKETKKKSRRRRKKSKGGATEPAAAAAVEAVEEVATETAEEVVDQVEEIAAEVEETVEEVAAEATETVEETLEEVTEAVTEEAEAEVEESADEATDTDDSEEEATKS
ncbi:MAG: 50S ribosomal protein L17 [Bacteroidota bacterium]